MNQISLSKSENHSLNKLKLSSDLFINSSSTHHLLRKLEHDIGAVDRIMESLDETYEKLTIINTRLPEFRGTADEDPLKWIREIERKTRSWKESVRMDRLRSCMEGAAYYWLEKELSKCNNLTFELFKTKFLQRFLDEDQREFALNKVRKMKYLHGEHKISSFIITFQHWYEQCHPKADEKALIEDLLSRFPADFRSKFMLTTSLSEIKDVDEFCKIAQRVEKALNIERDDSKETSRLMSARNDETLQQLLKEMREMKEKLAKLENSNLKRSKECFQCQKDWPACGCTKKCRFCPGQYPACKCRSKRDKPIQPATAGNASGSQ